MVQFPACAFRTVCVRVRMTGIQACRVTPFGYPGIAGYWLLPPAFRS